MIQTQIKTPLADEVLFGRLKSGGVVKVVVTADATGAKKLSFVYPEGPAQPRLERDLIVAAGARRSRKRVEPADPAMPTRSQRPRSHRHLLTLAARRTGSSGRKPARLTPPLPDCVVRRRRQFGFADKSGFHDLGGPGLGRSYATSRTVIRDRIVALRAKRTRRKVAFPPAKPVEFGAAERSELVVDGRAEDRRVVVDVALGVDAWEGERGGGVSGRREVAAAEVDVEIFASIVQLLVRAYSAPAPIVQPTREALGLPLQKALAGTVIDANMRAAASIGDAARAIDH